MICVLIDGFGPVPQVSWGAIEWGRVLLASAAVRMLCSATAVEG